MFAVDPERAGKPDWHLRDTDEVLDVAGKGGRREGILADMFELDARLLLDKGAALGGGFGRVVVLFVARNARPADCRMHRRLRLPDRIG